VEDYILLYRMCQKRRAAGITIAIKTKFKKRIHIYMFVNERILQLTLILLTTTIVAPPSNASKWQMGFNSAFKGLIGGMFISYDL
jgi:hypothetical protein